MIQQGERERFGEDSVQQQHDGVVVVEERGNPAGLRQAPRERRRRERGRAALKERRSRVLGNPKPQLYIGGRMGLRPL